MALYQGNGALCHTTSSVEKQKLAFDVHSSPSGKSRIAYRTAANAPLKPKIIALAQYGLLGFARIWAAALEAMADDRTECHARQRPPGPIWQVNLVMAAMSPSAL